jgi:LPS export ABC transporter protein LptC
MIKTGSSGRLLAVILCVFAAGYFSSCENDSAEIVRVTESKEGPSESIRDLVTLYSDSGRVKVKVTAPLLQRYGGENPRSELPKGLYIEFFNDSLKVISHLKARYAVQDLRERTWEAREDVVVVNQKGEQLNTEKLVWDERRELLSSDRFVKITTPEEIIFGEGFEANQDFSRYRIFNVKGRITVKK